MKQPNFIQTKLNYLGKAPKHVQVDLKSIDVDKVKIYEINDEQASKKPIDIDPIHLQNYCEESKPLESPLKEIMKPELSKKIVPDIKNYSTHEQQNQMNVPSKSTKKHKLSPFESHMHRIHNMINHFLSISQTNTTLKIPSQSFYNLCQARKKFLSTNLISTKDFFEAQYTNYMSFLQVLIQSKQRNYEIYDELGEFERIIDIIQNQIGDLTEIYIKDQQAKIFEIFSQEFTQNIENIAQKCDSLYKEVIKTANPLLKSDIQFIIEEKLHQNPVEEGQMNLKQLSNKSFNYQPRENLFSCLDERKCYGIGKNEISIEQQKNSTSQIVMEIEEKK